MVNDYSGEKTWTVGYPDLILRSTPSADYPYLERIPYGSEVIMISDGGIWALIYYNGKYGYCEREYINDDNPLFLFSPHPDTPETAFGTSYLRSGNKRANYKVKNLQLCLCESGFLEGFNDIDGIFGYETRHALKQFQKKCGLEPTGIAEDLTKTVLWDLYQDVLILEGFTQS